MSENNVKHIKSGEDLTDFFDFSNKKEFSFLFKFSSRCPVSFRIENNFDSWVDNQDMSKISIYKVNVVEDRTISQKIASKLDITHQSPQLIILNNNGDLIWYGSHYEIEEKKLNDIINRPRK